MPAIMYLNEDEMKAAQKVVGDPDLAELHDEVRRITGRNYLIRSQWEPEHKRWFGKNIPEFWHYQLFLDIGYGEVQIINLRDTADESGLFYSRRESAALITNYYLGIIGGYDDAKRKLAEKIHQTKIAFNLFREFTIRNSTQWEIGSGHHHPIWSYVAEQLKGYEPPTKGANWKFIQPGNIIPLEVLQYQEHHGNNEKN